MPSTTTAAEILHKLGRSHHLSDAEIQPGVLRCDIVGLCDAVLAKGSPCGGNEIDLADAAQLLSAMTLTYLGLADSEVEVGE